MQATSTQKATDLRPAILASLAAALFIAGIALGSVLDLGTTSTATAVAAPDTSYSAVEGARTQFGVAADTSYDAVEGLRAQSGVTEDTSLVGKSGFPSSRGISLPDEQRGAAGWWASAPDAPAPAPELERDGAFGHGYR